MHVAVGAVDRGRHIEAIDQRRRLEIPRPAGLDGRVPGIALDQRQPADFQIGARRDEQLRLPRLGQQRGLGLDPVRVLEGVGGRVNAHLVAADFLGQRPPFGHRGKDLQIGLGRQCLR
jgi:hypothetical protein